MYELPRIFVKPGEGVRVPLPVPGQTSVGADGAYVTRSMAVERLLRTKDLVPAEPPRVEAAAPAAPAAPAGVAKIEPPAPQAAADDKKKG